MFSEDKGVGETAIWAPAAISAIWAQILEQILEQA
jgi:hypothetical protein